MENRAVYKPCTSKAHDNFLFVPFVSERGETNIKSADTNKNVSLGDLSGEEASLFYQDVISSTPISLPGSSKAPQKLQTSKKHKDSSFINSRRSIFHYAQEGDIEGVKHFLSKQCQVDIQDMYGWTPLMCATFEGHYAVAELLIKNGAKLDIKNKQGMTALDIALSKSHEALINLFNNGNVIKTEIHKVASKKEVKYCNICNSSYEEPSVVHEKSIAHLFCCKNSSPSTYYYIPENNKGFQIMLKKGWDKNQGLGINADGRKFPVKTVLKTDRMCIGGKQEVPKVTHFGPKDYRSVKKGNQPVLDLKRERKIKKWKMKKLENKNRKFEIEFRRQFKLE